MASKYPPAPFVRSWWVEPNTLLAGFFPGDHDDRAAQEKLSALLDCGVTTFVNLMEPDEVNNNGERFRSYAPMLQELAAQRGLHAECVRFPIRDMGIPDVEMMIRILDAMDDAASRGKTVYVHCWGGVGRTGTVVGCWLARHGIAVGKDALERIEALRRAQHQQIFWMPSPQTAEQREFVQWWERGV
ncbi:MAG: dual specificity protein phosphatase family protein [Ignavibacteria bacterium]|nr:dual specificity protein phosphatase family protein [Ignavibacteria bacterium]